MSLDELIAPYRSDEASERLVALVDDVEGMRVLALWPLVPKAWAAPDKAPPDDENARWRWLWEGLDYDEEQLADMVELPLRTLQKKLTRLASARLIFPDGSVDKNAAAFVRTRVKQELK